MVGIISLVGIKLTELPNAGWATVYLAHLLIRVRPRFFDQVGLMHLLEISTFLLNNVIVSQTYQNYEQSQQKLGTFLVNKVL